MTPILQSFQRWKFSATNVPIFLILLQVFGTSLAEPSKNEAQMKNLMAQGIKYLSIKQPAEALSNFHQAVALAGSTDYLPFYHRATALLAVGRAEQAISDLDVVLERRPSFSSARLQRANALLRIGKPEEAIVDYDEVSRTDESADVALEASQAAEKTRELVALLGRAEQMTDPEMLKT